MASTFKLTLDTTAPAFSAVLNSGFPIDGERATNLAITIEEAAKEIQGYQYKIWGDVDPTADEHIQATEEESDWINATDEEESFTKEFFLSEGDGTKAIFIKFRDDVWNESSSQEYTVELNTTAPVITITGGPSAARISEVTGKDTSSFTFKANEALAEYEVRVVPEAGSNHTEGVALVEAHEPVASETNKEISITGTELEAAVGADGEYTIKVFGKNENGIWSL